MTDETRLSTGPEAFAVIPIDPGLTRPKAIIAGLMAAGHAAIARVASGDLWEGEREILVAQDAHEHAGRMALIWQRAARHLQVERLDTRRRCRRSPADPARSAPARSHTDR